jgi:hypothetical protein
VRRCQILLANDRGEWVPRLAAMLGCIDRTVRNVVKRFEQDGLDDCLTRHSSRAHTIHAKVDAADSEHLDASPLDADNAGLRHVPEADDEATISEVGVKRCRGCCDSSNRARGRLSGH